MTQAEALKRHFKSGKSLTQGEATGFFGCTRLAARILDLEADGMVFDHRRVEVPTRYGVTHVVRYVPVLAKSRGPG